MEKGRITGKERDGLLSAPFSLFVALLLDMTINLNLIFYTTWIQKQFPLSVLFLSTL